MGLGKLGVALRILGVAPTVGEKGVVLKVGETGASHLTPLHAPALDLFDCSCYIYLQICKNKYATIICFSKRILATVQISKCSWNLARARAS